MRYHIWAPIKISFEGEYLGGGLISVEKISAAG
jgi:hypothetical protein